jgi:phosphopantetheine adenylyltransferase
MSREHKESIWRWSQLAVIVLCTVSGYAFAVGDKSAKINELESRANRLERYIEEMRRDQSDMLKALSRIEGKLEGR